MKNSYLPIKTFYSLILVLVVSVSSYSQIRISAGGFIGGGTIKGNSPSIAAFTASFFIETNTVLFLEVTPRLSYIFAKDFNAIIPNKPNPKKKNPEVANKSGRIPIKSNPQPTKSRDRSKAGFNPLVLLIFKVYHMPIKSPERRNAPIRIKTSLES